MTALGSCGCHTGAPPARFNLSEPGWTIRQGQVVWRSKADAPEIAGELIVAFHSDGRIFLQFTKTPLPLVVARIGAGGWQIEFVAERRTLSGSGSPPEKLGWLQLARCAAGAVPPANWHWEKSGDGTWRLANRRTGETLEGTLAP